MDRAGVAVTWLRAGLRDLPATDGFDLVSAQYPAIRHDDDRAAVRVLVDAVAPGGTLLFVHHHLATTPRGDLPFDPDDYVQPHDVRAALGGDWIVEVDEVRPRPGPLPAEARHVDDVVLRARRVT